VLLVRRELERVDEVKGERRRRARSRGREEQRRTS
jgi:hypothetical protein